MNNYWILSDESLNSHGLIIKTLGINLDEFKENPVCLFNHDMNQVIGKWTDVHLVGSQLVAIPELDEEDMDAKKISKKIDKGLIKGCSIGIMVEDCIPDENENIVVLKSTLKECSITALPSNKNAIKLFYNGQEVSQKELYTFALDSKNKKINMTEEVKTVEEVIEEVKPIEEVIEEVKPIETVEEVIEVVKPIETVEEVKPIEEDVKLKIAKLLNLTYNNDIKSDNEILLSINTLQLKMKEYDTLINNQKNSEIENFVNENISNGKIKVTKEVALTMAKNDFENFKNLINGFKVQVKLTDIFHKEEMNDERKSWTYLEWSKKDPSALKEMKENNSPIFEKLMSDYLKNNKK